MKYAFLILVAFTLHSTAFAGNFVCRSRTQNFVIKQASGESLYLLYECNKALTSCTPAMVFESLGFEEEASFSLHGQRSNGQRAVVTMIRTSHAWTASLSSAYSKNLQDVLSCEPYKK